MKVGIYYGAGDIRLEERADSRVQTGHEAIVRVMHSCICGSDLWYWRGISKKESGTPIGHEFMGIVEETGKDVTHIQKGDFVISAFSISDGTCPECKAGMTSVCRNKQAWGRDNNDGGQGKKVRVPYAEGTLHVVPADKVTDKLIPALLPLTDVLCTGHHAAVSGEVGSGKTVAVIGDGAVGLCAVAASKRLGAKTIILVSTHPDRAAIGKQFGATHIVNARGEEAVQTVMKLTNGLGVDSMLECVGTDASWQTSFAMTRAGGTIGFVGVPHAADLPLSTMFRRNIGVKGGVAPAAAYIPELLRDVLAGTLDVSAIFTKQIALEDLAEGYKAMDERTAIKTLINISALT